MNKIKYCTACGRIIDKYGNKEKCLCGKHYKQLIKFGEIKDHNQRTVFDANEIRTFADYAEIDTYDSFGNVTETYKLDLEDLKYLGDKKWRTIYKKSSNKKIPYLGTGIPAVYFHRLILGSENKAIDHIDRNTLNNCKSNLRYVTSQESVYNTLKENKTGIKGIHYNSDGRKKPWHAECCVGGKRYYSPHFSSKNQAVYYRYLFESTLLKDFIVCNTEEMKNCINSLSNVEKKEVQKIFTNRMKVQV